MSVVSNDVSEHVRGKHGDPTRLLLKNDLEKDAACQIFSAPRVLYFEVLVGEHELLHLGQRDVSAGLGVIETPVGVLLDDAGHRPLLYSST